MRHHLEPDGLGLIVEWVTGADGAPDVLRHDQGCGCTGCQSFLDIPGRQTAAASILDPVTYTNYDEKPSLTFEEAAAQIGRQNAKWDDGDASTGGFVDGVRDPNALGSPGRVTWGFATQTAINGLQDADYLKPVTSAQEVYFRDAIAQIEAVSGLDFVQATGSGRVSSAGGADILIALEEDGWGGYASWSLGEGELSDALVVVGEQEFTSGFGDGAHVALHEMLHAAGLLHPSDYDGDGALSYEESAAYREDTVQWTVMSYWEAQFSYGLPSALMPHDIATLHRLYGAGDGRPGNTIYGVGGNSGVAGLTLAEGSGPMIGAIWDAGGTDTLDLSNSAETMKVDLREGMASAGYVYIMPGTTIERAVLGSGTNELTPHEETVFVDGGEGWDWLDLSHRNTGVNVSGPEGPTISGLTQLTTLSFERITGSAFGDFILGSSESDIEGGAGNDTLSGRWASGQEGDDLLYQHVAGGDLHGGEGNDTLMAYSIGGRFEGGNGYDTLDFTGYESALDTRLENGFFWFQDGAPLTVLGFERIILTRHADMLRGASYSDGLVGAGGNDTLFGMDGDDIIEGGDGDDLLFGDDGVGDWALNIRGTDGPDTLIGNLNDNTIDGGAGDDLLIPNIGEDFLLGGEGNDTLKLTEYANANGQWDDDTYLVESASFYIYDYYEFEDTGIDTADFSFFAEGQDFSSGWFRWSDDTWNYLEGIEIIIGTRGNDVIDTRLEAYGGLGDDTLFGQRNGHLDGGAGDDVLTGSTGSTLVGGTGADVFFSWSSAEGARVLDFEIGTDLLGFFDDQAETIAGLRFEASDQGTLVSTVEDGSGWSYALFDIAGLTPDDVTADMFFFVNQYEFFA